MTVTVKFFASLREQVGEGKKSLEGMAGKNVREIWSAATDCPMGDSVLSAINLEYVDTDAIVKDGDEVAFFPPVTGG